MGVGVGVGVEVGDAVGVGVAVGVGIGVKIGLGVEIGLGVAVGVTVECGVGLVVGDGLKKILGVLRGEGEVVIMGVGVDLMGVGNAVTIGILVGLGDGLVGITLVSFVLVMGLTAFIIISIRLVREDVSPRPIRAMLDRGFTSLTFCRLIV